MEKVTTILAYVGLAVMLVGIGYVGGRRSARSNTVAENATVMDTVWTEVHDTCWREAAVGLLRTDTVKLATVSILERVDTVAVHDSVYVEVPIERKTFTGENYRITAHGYRIGLDDVWISHPVVTATSTASYTRTRRWGFSVGAQIGYGYTVHGGSPYVGLGVGFGYTF